METIKIDKKINAENMGSFRTVLQYQFPCGDVVLYNAQDGSCIVQTSEFVTTYSEEEMKEIYNYPANKK